MSTLNLASVKTESHFNQEVNKRTEEVYAKQFTFKVTMEFSSYGDFSHLEQMTEKQRNQYINELIWRRNDGIEGVIK